MKKFLSAFALIALLAGCLALAGCGWDQTTLRSDKPVSRAKATNDIAMPFPPSAREIYYFFHAGGLQEYQLFVRFTVESNELDRAVNDILADHDKGNQQQLGYSSLSIAEAPDSPAPADLQPMPWWNPKSITNGFYRAATNGQPFEIRVDLSTHIIYVSASD